MNRWLTGLICVLFLQPAAYGIDPGALPLGFIPGTPLTDTIPPAINCPPSDTIVLPSGACTGVYTYSVVAYDDQPGYVINQLQGLPSGAEFPIGQTLNWFAVVDVGGNIDECSFTLTVLPAANVLICKDMVAVSLDSNCYFSPTPEMLLNMPFGCPGNYTVETDKSLPLGNGPWVPAVYGFSDIDKTHAFRVTNNLSGNNCWGQITINDNTPPKIHCADIDLPCLVDQLTPAYLHDSLLFSAAIPLVTDNCYGNSSVDFFDLPQNLPCTPGSDISRVVKRTWSAVDGRGNLSTCLQTINLRRMLSEVQLPDDLVLGCQDAVPAASTAGLPYITLANRRFLLTEETSCELDALYADSVAVLCPGSTRIVRQWTIYDACADLSPNNPLTGVQYIDLVDTLGPQIECPAGITVNLDGINCTGKALLPDFVVYENCSSIQTIQVKWTALGTAYSQDGTLQNWPGNMPFLLDTLAHFDTLALLEAGNVNIQLIAADGCGNLGFCDIPVTVLDSQLPVAVCDSSLSVNVPVEGQFELGAGVLDDGSLDACSPVFFKAQRLDPGCFADTLWHDQVRFCCSDVGNAVAVLLRVYDFETPQGPVANGFGNGHFSTCLTMVNVNTASAPSCVAPPDTLLPCTLFDPTLEAYGMPLLSCSTDSFAVLMDVTQFDSTCSSGTIVRQFQVFNAVGEMAECSQQIVIDFSQDYYMRFPDDIVVSNCTASGIYGEPVVFNQGCGDTEISYTDEVFTVVPDACYKIERTWTITNACTYDPLLPLVSVPNPNPNAVSNHPSNLPGPVVSAFGSQAPWTSTIVKISPTDPAPTDFSIFWMADANGYRYKQIIKVIDSESPLVMNCPLDTLLIQDPSNNDTLFWRDDFYQGGVDFCEGQTNLNIETTDLCSGAAGSISYILYLDLDGDGASDTEINSANPPPPGKVVYNGTAYYFDSRNVPANQKFRWDIQQTVQDQVRSARVIWNTQANPTMHILPQIPPGTHKIKWIVMDLCGNQSICEYPFTVNNTSGSCPGSQEPVLGTLATENGAGVQYANVALQFTAPNGTQTLQQESDLAGGYFFTPGVPYHASYFIEPKRLDYVQNGVTTFDLILVSKHILGIEMLDSPYKRIAADANRSNTITTFDIVEFRKLILGIYDFLPNNTSWRFIDQQYVFPDPEQPFNPAFPETVQEPDLEPGDNTQHNFVGVKVGDVNNSAVANGLLTPDDRTASALMITYDNVMLEKGQLYDIAFHPDTAITGWQGSIVLAESEIVELVSGLPDDGYALFDHGRDLRFCWFTTGAAEQPTLVLRLRAGRSGRLSDEIKLGNLVTPSEAIDAEGQMVRPELQVIGTAPVPDVLCVAVLPNPFSNQAVLRFSHTRSENVCVEVFDAQGRLVLRQSDWYEAGSYQVPLQLPSSCPPGLYSLRLVAGRSVAYNKLQKL